MRLSEFDYDLPRELIAQFPLPQREKCRLMVVDRGAGTIEHRVFSDLPVFFGSGDSMVFNDTRVVTCRLNGRRLTGGKVEVFLLPAPGDQPLPGNGFRCKAMISPGRVKPGERIQFAGASCVVTGRDEVCFEGMNRDEVFALGAIPLPPYIKREALPEDSEFYQTVYARCDGSVAAPTAGLHFTPAVIEALRNAGTATGYLTLHVGTATFKSVTSQDIEDHAMGAEYYSIPPETVGMVGKNRSRVCAVGTTSCRSLESWAASGMTEGQTRLFIYPGYRFRIVDRLLTNFHLPKTTLFMLVCALGGTELVQKAYAEAIREKYRFYSYGDAMLVI